MFKKYFIASCVAFFVTSNVAYCDDSTDLVNEFINVSGISKMFDTAQEQNIQSFKDGAPNDLNDKQKAIVDEYSKKLLKLYRNDYGFEKIRASVGSVYKKYFTDDDLRALIAFYKSDVGQKVLTKNPQIYKEVSAISSQVSQEAQPKVQALMQEMMGKLKAAQTAAQK